MKDLRREILHVVLSQDTPQGGNKENFKAY